MKSCSIFVLSLLYFIVEQGCISHWCFEENIIANSCDVGRVCFLYLGLYVSVYICVSVCVSIPDQKKHTKDLKFGTHNVPIISTDGLFGLSLVVEM